MPPRVENATFPSAVALPGRVIRRLLSFHELVVETRHRFFLSLFFNLGFSFFLLCYHSILRVAHIQSIFPEGFPLGIPTEDVVATNFALGWSLLNFVTVSFGFAVFFLSFARAQKASSARNALEARHSSIHLEDSEAGVSVPPEGSPHVRMAEIRLQGSLVSRCERNLRIVHGIGMLLVTVHASLQFVGRLFFQVGQTDPMIRKTIFFVVSMIFYLATSIGAPIGIYLLSQFHKAEKKIAAEIRRVQHRD